MLSKLQAAFVRRRLKKNDDYLATFRSEHGRRVLLDLIQKNHIISPTIVAVKGRTNLDPLEIAFNEGRRNAILEILSELNMDREQIEKLMRESNNASQVLDQA